MIRLLTFWSLCQIVWISKQSDYVADPEQIEHHNNKQQLSNKYQKVVHKEYQKYMRKLQNYQRQYEQLAYQSRQNRKKDDQVLDTEMRNELQKLQQKKLLTDKEYQQKLANIYSRNLSDEDKKKIEEEYRKLYLIQEIRHDKNIYVQLKSKQVIDIYEDVKTQPTLLKIYFVLLGQQAIYKNSMIQVQVTSPTKKILETKSDKQVVIVEFQAKKTGTYKFRLTNMNKNNVVVQIIQEKEGKYDETMKRAMFLLNKQKNYTEERAQNMTMSVADYEKIVYLEKNIRSAKKELGRVANLNSHFEDQFNYFFDELEFSQLDFQKVTIYESVVILGLAVIQVFIFKRVFLKDTKI